MIESLATHLVLYDQGCSLLSWRKPSEQSYSKPLLAR